MARKVAHTRRSVPLALVVAGTLLVAGCGPSPTPQGVPEGASEFQGTLTAAGSRHTIQLGPGRQASVGDFEGTLLLSGPSRPAVGFRAQAIVLNDTAIGLVGRAVWTNERGEQVYSELTGSGDATGNRIVGTFIGGTGRFAHASGTYEFAWRFVLEGEDGTVQGQSEGLRGRIRFDAGPTGATGEAKRP